MPLKERSVWYSHWSATSGNRWVGTPPLLPLGSRQRRQKRGNNLETTIRNPSLFLFLYFILIYFFFYFFLLWILQLLSLLLVRFASFQREMFSDMQRAPTRHIASSPKQPTSAEISPLWLFQTRQSSIHPKSARPRPLPSTSTTEWIIHISKKTEKKIVKEWRSRWSNC